MSQAFPYRIREATRGDVPSILQLIKDLAEYEREPWEVTVTEETLLRDGFGERPYFYVIVVEKVEQTEAETKEQGESGPVVGFAMYFWSYSSWKGKFLYLEDLYVRPEYRNHGIGKALMIEIGKIASREKCVRMQWVVLNWNQPSKDFYEEFVGAKCLGDWQLYRVTEDGIREFIEKRAPKQTTESQESSEQAE